MEIREKNEIAERILARRLQLLEEIYDLTRSQREAVRSENWKDLKTILDKKDRRIRQFQETEKSVKGWKSLRGMAEKVPSVKKDLKEIEVRLSAIHSIEEDCTRLFGDRKDKAAKALQEFMQGREGIRRFRSRGRGVPRFVDVRK
jgi:hypothetical protein